MFRRFVLPRLVYWFYRLWTWTWRIEVHETPELTKIKTGNIPLIFAHWHRDELSIVHFVTSYRIATMTSTSADGQLIDYVIHKLGGATSKGSSTRGGSSALRGLVQLMHEGYRASMAVDGPKGPIYQVKPGVFELSKLAGAWIAPLGVANSSQMIFQKSWNKARLPKPFARVVVCFGKLMKIDGEPRDYKLAQELAREIDSACDAATFKIMTRRTEVRELLPDQKK